MTFRNGDGFDFYSGATTGAFPLTLLYTFNDVGPMGLTATLIDGRFGGKALRLTYTNPVSSNVVCFLNRPFNDDPSQFTVEFAFRRPAYNLMQVGMGVPIYRLRYGPDVQMSVGVNFHGELVLWEGDWTTTPAAVTVGANLAEDNWYTGKLEVDASSSPTRVTAYIDGAEALETGEITLAAGKVDSYEYCVCSRSSQAGGGLPVMDFDDFYWADDPAGAWQPMKSEPLRPNLDASPNDWTPSTGTDHFALVDDVTGDGDTTYLSTGSAGDKDRFSLTDLSSNPDEIYALQAVTLARKTDAGLVQIRTNFVSGAAVANGHTQTLGLNYGVEFDVIEIDPDSGTALDGFEVNAMQIEIERTA